MKNVLALLGNYDDGLWHWRPVRSAALARGYFADVVLVMHDVDDPTWKILRACTHPSGLIVSWRDLMHRLGIEEEIIRLAKRIEKELQKWKGSSPILPLFEKKCACGNEVLEKTLGLRRRESDFGSGPDKTGWSIINGAWGSDPSFVNIEFCPRCGGRLPEEP